MWRIASLVVLLTSLAALHGARQGSSHLLGGVIWVAAGFSAVVASVMLVFDLAWGRPSALAPAESGFDADGNPRGTTRILGPIGLLFFGAALVFIAGRSMVRGLVPAFGGGPDVAWATRPVAFMAWVAVWLALGLGAWLLCAAVLQSFRKPQPKTLTKR